MTLVFEHIYSMKVEDRVMEWKFNYETTFFSMIIFQSFSIMQNYKPKTHSKKNKKSWTEKKDTEHTENQFVFHSDWKHTI